MASWTASKGGLSNATEAPVAAASHLSNKMTALWGLPLPGRRAGSVVLPGPTGHFINQRRWATC